MDYEATVKYLKCLFPKVSDEELCWAYIESEGNIDRAAGLILDGQNLYEKTSVKLQRAQDALHRHETYEAKECSANQAKGSSSGGSSVYEDVPEAPARFEKLKKSPTSDTSSYHSLPYGDTSSGCSAKHFANELKFFEDLPKAPQNKPSAPSSLPDLASDGSDSYTDVTSRHSSEGADNSLTTVESTISASTPSYACNEARAKTSEYRRKGDLDLTMKFTVPKAVGPTTVVGGMLARVLIQSGCHQFELRRVDATPRADYEEQASEYSYNITLSPEGEEEHDEMIVRFTEKFCYFVAGGFHDQILAEFPGIKLIFGEVRPQHNNVTLTSMAIGSMPNQGLFFLPNKNDRVLAEEKMDGLRFAAYKISLPYAAIVQIIVDVGDSHNNTLYLKLKYPPQVWQAVPRTQQCRSRNRRVVNMEQCKEWVRVLKWPGDERSTGCSNEALADCLCLRVTLPKKNEDGNDVNGCSNLEALLSRGAVVSDQLLADEGREKGKAESVDNHLFFEKVRWSMKECSRACEEALENLLCAIDERRVMDLVRAFHKMYTVRVNAMKRYQHGDLRDLKRTLPRNCVLVRKVMVTPLRTLFMAPEVMMTNRVVRRFGEENALRCVFRDDSGARLIVKDFVQGPCYDQQSSIVANIVQRTLSHGVEINNRHYHFLAWSNSQMRDHGCYMYASMQRRNGDSAMTVEEMREWMGDFSSSKNVPKLMSRMGQCFTQAQPTVTIKPNEWCIEKDVEGGAGHPETHEPYCFSDGCGRISPSLARRVALTLQLDIVRFKGFKGVLAIDPCLDLSNQGLKLVFRKSQMKFKERCDDQMNNVLEVKHTQNIDFRPVMITKNPCHVAGDVRMFTAVYQPALAHLFDVVVFPRHGPRPHPDEMAGSDLDGDEYSVIFDPDIHFDHNEEAMTFPKSTPDDFESTDDMVDFFLKYLRQDSIGRMSNAHLILADRKGLFDEVCNGIARKCAIAVDFPKSGEPAEPLTVHEQSDIVPDYMFSVVKPMYRSPRLNGQIYRKAKKVEEVLDMAELTTSVFEQDVDQILCPPGFDPFRGDESARMQVRRLRDEYAAKMQQLLDEYGVSDEASIVSGHIVSLKRLATMERDDYSFYHTDRIVELRYTRIYHHLQSNSQSAIISSAQEFGGETAVYQRDPSGKASLRSDENMEMKALQWYKVCYDEDPRFRPSSPSLSFPWVVWDVLCSYKRNKMLAQGATAPSTHPLADRFSIEIQSDIEKNIDEYEVFCVDICEECEFVQRYNIAYGPRLMYILFVLERWLTAELFRFCRLTMEHVALLFLQFGLGIAKLPSDISEASRIRLFPYKLMWDEKIEKINHSVSDCGLALIFFLRYLASQQFSMNHYLDLSLRDGRPTPYPILLRQPFWEPLHQLAFRTYHYIAVSGRFDAIYVGERIEDWSESESRDPIIVSSSLLRQNYGESPLSAHRILDLLQEWTGVSQIFTRNLYQNRRNDVILITSVGTATARQRLARLLLLPIDQLRRAIRDEVMPASIRDESL
ncbi:unnamed protein product [Cylicocyclus nassatus]|uniref:RNA-directed RNA polymerase n=2 Tax=Strongylidae TaxID=27830 RepID=A0AA36M5Q5_CYLNA|nr:unnamed protein product [Cylicocyclus nassatus]